MLCNNCGYSITSFVPFWIVSEDEYSNGIIYCSEKCMEVAEDDTE